MDNKAIAREWFLYADRDLETAKYLQGMHPTPLEIICYHCQQSAEKNLKGFIAFNGGEIQKTHDLVSLNKLCTVFKIQFQNILDDCINLTDYGVQARYPFNIEINEKDMVHALKYAETIKLFIVALLKEI